MNEALQEASLDEVDRSDAQLIMTYLDGDAGALEVLFERYRRPFYSYLNRMLRQDRTGADDLFQELWLRIIRKLPDCRKIDNFAGWSFRIAHNLTMEHYRRLARLRKIGEPTGDGELPDEAAAIPEPGGGMDSATQQERLTEALKQLGSKQLEVFELRRQGVDFKEIARIQECPVNTALGRMHKAVMILKKHLAGE